MIATLSTSNTVQIADAPIHNWYRFILSYPPHLVRHYLDRYAHTHGALLDPFCGTGTTLVEGMHSRMEVYGCDANPMTYFASKAKTDWQVEPADVRYIAEWIYKKADALLSRNIRIGLTKEVKDLLITDSISDLPLSKALVLRGVIQEWQTDPALAAIANLALAKTLVFCASNLKFSPNVTVGKIKQDADVLGYWYGQMQQCADDLVGLPQPQGHVSFDDARTMRSVPGGMGMVITSPPYPCEHDYTAHTRLESVVLGFYSNRHSIRETKEQLLRSNSRGVYKADAMREHIQHIGDITALSAQVEARRLELGKTSGFERQYHRVVEEYFGGMALHLQALMPKLNPGAQCCYVLGDQHSYFQIPIKTAELLGQVAESLGYTDVTIERFRQRAATKGSEKMIDENVLLFQAPK